MERLLRLSGLIVLILLCTANVSGAETFEDSIIVKFSDPNRSGLVKAVFGSGDITVTGYKGKEVIIETKSKIKNVLTPPKKEKAKGLKRISGSAVNVTTIKDGNVIVITRSINHEVEMFIKVPFKTSLQLGGGLGKNLEFGFPGMLLRKKTPDLLLQLQLYYKRLDDDYKRLDDGGIFEGNITVKNVSGEMEISTLKGDITLLDISGDVVASSLDDDILVSFKNVNKKSSMYFSSVDGDIDVTFPPDIQVNLTLKNIEGDIYTDFDMDIEKIHKVDKEMEIEKMYKLDRKNGMPGSFLPHYFGTTLGNNISGKLNGGGPEIQMITIEGDIYIRKGKK